MNFAEGSDLPDIPQAQSSHLTQQVLLARITDRIRKSLELQEILSATVAEVRSFLGTDRVKIYQFQPGGHGLVIAESLAENRLPSLLDLHFPADDIPLYARELYLQARQRTIVDLSRQQIGLSPLDRTEAEDLAQDIRYRPIDPCHVEYMRAMGVESSVVVPIVIESQNLSESELPSLHAGDRLWGLLVSHHSESREVTEAELAFVQSVVDQVSIAISQSILLARVREQAQQEADINRITALLYATSTLQLQEALEETVAVFQGSGGRLYLPPLQTQQSLEIYTCGIQPERLDRSGGRPIEENLLWQRYLNSSLSATRSDGKAQPWSVKWMRAAYALAEIPHESSEDSGVWAIADLYREPLFRALTPAFQPTSIRGVLIVPLHFGQELIGCLTVFRDDIERELMWAGYHNPDTRQLAPRQSFEAWRQIKTGQAQEWTEADIRLAQALSERFCGAAKQYRLYQQVQLLNANLERQVEVRTAQLQQSNTIANQQKTLAGILAKMQQSSDVETIFGSATQEVRQLLNVDRVSVYRFNADWGGEFMHDYGSIAPGWAKIVLGAGSVWDDTYLQETQGGRYRDRQILAVPDIYAADFTPCHVENLEHFSVRAFLTVPLFVGQKLWGLLAAYQHTSPRDWDESEVAFVQQIAAHLGIALQQGESLEQVQKQAKQLATLAEQQQTLMGTISKIRESLDLDKIFKATTQEIRRLLNADRVAVFRFHPESGCTDGEFVSEDVLPPYTSALAAKIHDRCFGERQATYYQQGRTWAADDIYALDLPECHISILSRFQVRANLVVPLLKGEQLWGLLCIHQCSGVRHWREKEKEFVTQIATQLGVALQQTELLHQAQNARDAANTANKAKSEFLANMSHELRTPLNAILGFVQIMNRDTSLNREQKEHLEIIGSSGEHLLGLINDVLEMSRIEAGQTILNESSFDLTSLLRSLHAMLELKAESKGVKLVFESTSNVPQYIHADKSKLRQVLINLLGNAIKFTDEGQVTLRTLVVDPRLLQVDRSPLETAQGTRDALVLHFSVEDTGEGIASDELDSLFEAFMQTESGRKSQEGSGLGLPISRRFVRLMGGDITVASKPGVGSTFQFAIQVASADRSEVEPVKLCRQAIGLESGQPIYRILVVEDKLVNRQLLVSLLTKIGFEVREATNGEEAIACWETWQPHLIWMDMRMPVMDGSAATREIRSRQGEDVPIILALTANAFEEDRSIALEIGCEDFVRKPYQTEQILEKMAQYLGVRYIYAETACEIELPIESIESEDTASPFDPADLETADLETANLETANLETANLEIANLEKIPTTNAKIERSALKILLVEDTPVNQKLMVRMLKELTDRVDCANNGLEALEALRQQTYDVVLMDVQMPEMDGLEATRCIRQEWGDRSPYIIGLTGYTLPEEHENCLAAGMDVCLSKPVRIASLFEALRSKIPDR